MSFYLAQPYYSRHGHYKKYTDELSSIEGSETLVVIDKNATKDIPGGYKVLVGLFTSRYLWVYRFVNLFLLNIALLRLPSRSKIVVLEFELINFLIFYPFYRIKHFHLVQTLHSCKAKSRNWLEIIQKKLAKSLLSRQSYVKVVVHLKECQEMLGVEKTYFNNYPGSCKVSKEAGIGLKILGVVRPDKNVFEFLESFAGIDCNLSVHGVLKDSRIDIARYPNVDFNDEFLSDQDYCDEVASARAIVIPYGTNYSGGAGPLSDAISAGVPLIVNREFFMADYLDELGIAIIYKDDFQDALNDLHSKEEVLLRNLKNIRSEYTWDGLRLKYFKALGL